MISFLSLLAGLLTRRWYFGLFIVLLSAINLLLMCAVLGITKISFTSLCLILPILVVVVGSTEAIHLFCSYTRGLRRHQGLCARSVIFMIKDVGKACIMTGLTTALGLFSFYLSGSPAFKDFAVIGGAAMLISGVTTLFFIPLFLSFLSHKQQHIQQSNSFFVRWFVWLKNLTMNLLRVNTKFLYGLLLVITVAALFCSVFKFNVDEEARNIFVDTHPLIQQQKDFTKDFGGYGYMTVSISPLSNADFFAPSTLLAVDQLRVELPKLGYVSSV